MIIVQFLENNSKIRVSDLKHPKDTPKDATLTLEPGIITENNMDVPRVAVLLYQLLKRNNMLANCVLVALTEPVITEHRLEEVRRAIHMLGLKLNGIQHFSEEVSANLIYQGYIEKRQAALEAKKREKEEMSLLDRTFKLFKPSHSKYGYSEPPVFHVEEYLFWEKETPEKKVKIADMTEGQTLAALHELQQTFEDAYVYSSSFGNWCFERPEGEFDATMEELQTIAYFLKKRQEQLTDTLQEDKPVERESSDVFHWNSLKEVPLPKNDGIYMFTIESTRNGSTCFTVLTGELKHDENLPNNWQIIGYDLRQNFSELEIPVEDGYDRIVAWAMKPKPFGLCL